MFNTRVCKLLDQDQSLSTIDHDIHIKINFNYQNQSPELIKNSKLDQIKYEQGFDGGILRSKKTFNFVCRSRTRLWLTQLGLFVDLRFIPVFVHDSEHLELFFFYDLGAVTVLWIEFLD